MTGVVIHGVKEADSPLCCRVVVDQTVTVQPGQEFILSGRLSINRKVPPLGMIEPTPKMVHQKGILVARTLVDASGRDSVPVRILNVHHDPVILYKNTNIALLHPVDDVSESVDCRGTPSEDDSPEIKDLIQRSSADLTEVQRD